MPGNDEGRPCQGDRSSSDTNTTQATSRRRLPVPDTSVVADSYLSVGFRGRPRLYILVRRCAWCGMPHCHTGKPEFQAGARMASCRGGRYLVHVVTVEAGSVAA